MEIKRVHPFSVFKIGGIFGFFTGCMYVLISVVGCMIFAEKVSPSAYGEALPVIILPIPCGILGAIFGAIGAALYNLVAKLVGGVKLKLEE